MARTRAEILRDLRTGGLLGSTAPSRDPNDPRHSRGAAAAGAYSLRYDVDDLEITADGALRIKDTIQNKTLHPRTTKVGQASIMSGTGTPESAVPGKPGDLFLRTDGGASTSMYIKETGVSTTTGWVAK